MLIRPPATEPDLTAMPKVTKVLIPLDGSIASEEILEQAFKLFGTEGVEYTLTRVISPLAVTEPPDPRVTSVKRQATHPASLLHAEAERLRDRGATVHERLVVNHSPVRAIAAVADEIGADVVAMTTHARRGVSRFVMGSVADGVLRTAVRPVLLYHPKHEVLDVRRRVEAAAVRAAHTAVPL
jgi:nucleotide-binding universal stress UspA family protein